MTFKLKDIPELRLNSHRLVDRDLNNPAEVVSYFGAMQSQEFYGGLWSVSLRLKNYSQSKVEGYINNGKIVKTWPMRGTIHLIDPQDLKWMQSLLATRVLKKFTSYYKKAGLSEKVFDKSRQLVIDLLKKHNSLTRPQIYKYLNDNNIETSDMKGMFILGRIAHESIICFGPRIGKQQTFVLVDSWIKNSKKLSNEEALKQLAIKYFTSHGPAQINDFMYWSGLTKKESLIGVEHAVGKIKKYEIDKEIYYASPDMERSKYDEAILFQPYDEYTVAYKERNSIFDQKYLSHLKKINFYSVLIIGGKVMGFWKRDIKGNKMQFTINSFKPLNNKLKTSVEKSAYEYALFFGSEVSNLNFAD